MDFREFCKKTNISEKDAGELIKGAESLINELKELIELSDSNELYDEFDAGYNSGCMVAVEKIQEFFGLETEEEKKKKAKEEKQRKLEEHIMRMCDSPRIPNKYELTMDKIRQLKVLRPEKTTKSPFGKNVNYPGKWQIVISINSQTMGTWFEDAFFSMIGSDTEVEDVSCTVMEMCSYNFNNFYNPEEIETTADFEIQEKILEKINPLIDNGIFGLTDD